MRSGYHLSQILEECARGLEIRGLEFFVELRRSCMLVRTRTPRKCNLDAEIDEGADLGGLVLARWVEGVERKTLAVPTRKKIDQRSTRQQFFDAPTDDLSDTGAGDALLQHRLRIGEGQRAAGRNGHDLLPADELSIERPSCVRVLYYLRNLFVY
jgi:hypothetical protein